MEGDVRLRPVTDGDLDVVIRCHTDPEGVGEFHWYGWQDAARWRRRFAETGLLEDDSGHLVIVLGQERLGLVTWQRLLTGPQSSCWTVAVALLPQARGHGYAAQALRHLVTYLFTHTPAERIQAHTESGNLPEEQALEQAGFTPEGVLRSYAFRAGAWRDVAVYGVLRDEPTSPRWRSG
jgi:RimJ/RimL family protein N-acetyltransferase